MAIGLNGDHKWQSRLTRAKEVAIRSPRRRERAACLARRGQC